MSNIQKILAAVGGVALLAALVLAYFIWDASSVASEMSEELDARLGKARSLAASLPLKPKASELKVYGDNAEAYETWRTEAAKVAAAGDLVFEPTTEAALKAQMVAEAHRLAERSGRANGRLVKPDFGFGFHDYIVGGKLPAKADLKRLQREWNDVSAVLTVLADCGAMELTDVRLGARKEAAAAAEAEEAEKPARGRRNKKAKRKVASEKAAEGAEADGAPAVTAFAADAVMRPDSLVRALNAFATNPRFIVVNGVRFVRDGDALMEALGGDGAKKAEPTGGRRRRGGRGAAAKEDKQADEGAKSGMVTDPSTASPLKVTLEFSVYDFHTLEGGQEK